MTGNIQGREKVAKQFSSQIACDQTKRNDSLQENVHCNSKCGKYYIILPLVEAIHNQNDMYLTIFAKLCEGLESENGVRYTLIKWNVAILKGNMAISYNRRRVLLAKKRKLLLLILAT